MPFPPTCLHQKMLSPGKELFRKKHASNSHQTSFSKTAERRDAERDMCGATWTPENVKHFNRRFQHRSKLPIRKPTFMRVEGRNATSLIGPSKSQDSMHARNSSCRADEIGEDEEAEERLQFTLCLTPEAILVLQKRCLQKQMAAKTYPRSQNMWDHGSKQSQDIRGRIPVSDIKHTRDVTALVKVSLLNDEYKYDDEEYEDVEWGVDEAVFIKCQEWLKGVEGASAPRRALPLYTDIANLQNNGSVPTSVQSNVQ